MADSAQYPSAAEMEKRWVVLGRLAAAGCREHQPNSHVCAAFGALRRRCVQFLARLWHCPDVDFMGTGVGWTAV